MARILRAQAARAAPEGQATLTMNNDDLDKMLGDARVPDRPADYWDAFPARVVRSLRAGGQPALPGRPAPWRLGIALAGAAALGLVAGFALWHGHPARGDDYA